MKRKSHHHQSIIGNSEIIMLGEHHQMQTDADMNKLKDVPRKLHCYGTVCRTNDFRKLCKENSLKIFYFTKTLQAFNGFAGKKLKKG